MESLLFDLQTILFWLNSIEEIENLNRPANFVNQHCINCHGSTLIVNNILCARHTMASQQGFTFPPPPPPPPPTQQYPQAIGNANGYAPQNAFSHRGNYRGGSGGNGFRGRGRGGMNRGGRGGANHHPNNYRNNNNHNQGIYGGGYTPLPSNASNTPNFYQNGTPSSQIYPPVAQSFATQTHGAPSPTYPPRNYNTGQGNATTGPPNVPVQTYPGQSVAYGGNSIPHPVSQSHSSSGGTAAVVAPPMRWGYDNNGAGGFYPGSTNGSSFQAMPFNPTSSHGISHGGNAHYNKSGQKRAFSSAFEKPTSQVPRVAAPPAVPSFGVPLPAKPPQPADTPRKALKKKKRKFNQLGLTPKTEEHESSEEDDDVDEESRLASSTVDPATGPVQITFRGRTSTLNTAADIQSWIEERKKRFPTQARVEERKKAQEEAKKQREHQREEARRKQSELKEQREQAKRDSKEQKTGSNPMDAALKAKAKAEKLRKKLLKEERRLQKAEADAERARLVAEASQQQSSADIQTTAENVQNNDGQSSAEKITDGTTQTPAVETSIPLLGHADTGNGNLSNISDSSEVDDISDENEDDDDDDAPEVISSRREGPERVPPPPREGPKRNDKLCRAFQRRGKCPRGNKCRYSHEIPADGVEKSRPVGGMKPGAGSREQSTRRGLFQMVCTISSWLTRTSLLMDLSVARCTRGTIPRSPGDAGHFLAWLARVA